MVNAGSIPAYVQYIQLGKKGWNVLVYYGVHKEDFLEVEDALKQLGCSRADISQFVNTAIHEAKHVQSHICSYYGIPEDGEEAAYLIGYLVQRMYKMFSKIIRQYV